MGAIRYKYSFDHPPRIEDIADRFRALTGLEVTVKVYGNAWELTAEPLRGHIEVSYDGDTVWVVAFRERWLSGSYFVAAFQRTLHELGAHRRPAKSAGYATQRWEDLPGWRRWLSR